MRRPLGSASGVGRATSRPGRPSLRSDPAAARSRRACSSCVPPPRPSLRSDRTRPCHAWRGGARGTPCRCAWRPAFDAAATPPLRPWGRRFLRLRRLPPRAGPSPRGPVPAPGGLCHGRRAGQPATGRSTLTQQSRVDRGRRRRTTPTSTSVASLRPGDRHDRTG